MASSAWICRRGFLAFSLFSFWSKPSYYIDSSKHDDAQVCLGHPDQKGVLPFRHGKHRYTAAVDSTSNPEIFVTTEPGAAYPAYVILPCLDPALDICWHNTFGTTVWYEWFCSYLWSPDILQSILVYFVHLGQKSQVITFAWPAVKQGGHWH